MNHTQIIVNHLDIASKKIESQIADLEANIEQIDLELAQNYDEVSARPNFFETYKAKKKQLDDLMLEWEEVEEEIAGF